MGLLDWMNRGGQAPVKSPAVSTEQPRQKARIKQPGDPFRAGDRVVVHEPFHNGRDAKRPPREPGVVNAVYHDGTLINYERAGRRPGNAPTEDVRHASEQDTRDYTKQFAAIEAKLQRRSRSLGWER
ncbi:MAG TPA: hypothetical protein VMH80_03710 [Bryobacteraceae bacterium]|nr:hypothetical protein [Bryobacteraceae bacterium]